ncbi:hypothetical protein [Bradyrhizobium sp. SZCCHNRI1029]|uniref:hypothetical protein n=1 Tax=Bradyrhizobium sp. SZCCHNRI1029 TaxID=3057278 RepID=UPI0029168CCF|nr:hypothetical protein [Bradyrhizobium sp. SZCCHNRI1029]
MAAAAIKSVISALQLRDDRTVRVIVFRMLLRSVYVNSRSSFAYLYDLDPHEFRYPRETYPPDILQRYLGLDYRRELNAVVPALALRSLLRAWLDFFGYPLTTDLRFLPHGSRRQWDEEFWHFLVHRSSIRELARASIALDPALSSLFGIRDFVPFVVGLLELQPELLVLLARRDVERDFWDLVREPLWPSEYPGDFSVGWFGRIFLFERYASENSLYSWLDGVARGEPRFARAEHALHDLDRFLALQGRDRDEDRFSASQPSPRPSESIAQHYEELERRQRDTAELAAEARSVLDGMEQEIARAQTKPEPPSVTPLSPPRAPRSPRLSMFLYGLASAAASKVAGWLSSPLTGRYLPASGAADVASDARYGDASRYTDISIFNGAPERLGARVEPDCCLVFNRIYTLEAAIRHVPIGLPAEGERTDVTPLISQTGPSELLAVLTSDDVAPGQAGGVDIPFPVQTVLVPVAGDSERQALFRITPLGGTGTTRRCNLVLRLYYKLDLIDQIRISVLIGAAEIAMEPGATRPVLFLETVRNRALPDFALDLAPRSLNIVVSRPPDGARTRLDFVLPQHDLHLVGAVNITNSELGDLLSKIRDRLFDIALDAPVGTTDADPLAFRDQMRQLAQLGEQAKQMLFDFGKADAQASLRRIEEVLRTALPRRSIVQIAIDETAHDFQFPWSILFCGADWRTASDVADFWGFRFVIEEKPASILLADPAPAATRDLSFAYWDKFTTLKAQNAALAGGTNATPPVAVKKIDSRKQFVSALTGDVSDILYVFSHGLSRSPDQSVLTLLLEKLAHAPGTPFRDELIALFKVIDPTETNDSWIKLTKSSVSCADVQCDEYVLNRHPIIILNMCQSAVLWPGVSSSFVRLFLQRRASAVIGTECTVPENFADWFGRLMLEQLFKGEPLGVSFLHAREELARANSLLGLAYSLYGSASAGLA